MVGRVGADSYACADAAYVSLEYRVIEATTRTRKAFNYGPPYPSPASLSRSI